MMTKRHLQTALAVPVWAIVAATLVFVATLLTVNILLFGQSASLTKLQHTNHIQAKALQNLSATVRITPGAVLKGFVCGSGMIATGGPRSPAFQAELHELGLPTTYCVGYKFPESK